MRACIAGAMGERFTEALRLLHADEVGTSLKNSRLAVKTEFAQAWQAKRKGTKQGVPQVSLQHLVLKCFNYYDIINTRLFNYKFGGLFMTIKQNKSQTILYAIITFVVAVGLFGFVIFDMRKLPHDYSFILDNTVVYWLFKVPCLIGGFFSAAGGGYLFKQMFSKKPLIEICDEYFYDNSSAISLGKIDWSEMESVYIKGGFLNIKLKNPDVYLKNKNWLQMFMIKSNYRLGYGDVCISPERFKKDRENFLNEFTKRRAIDQ